MRPRVHLAGVRALSRMSVLAIRILPRREHEESSIWDLGLCSWGYSEGWLLKTLLSLVGRRQLASHWNRASDTSTLPDVGDP